MKCIAVQPSSFPQNIELKKGIGQGIIIRFTFVSETITTSHERKNN